MKKLIFLSLSLAALVIVMTTSCKKREEPSVATAPLYFHLHTNIDTNEVDGYGDVYNTASGRKMSLTLAQLYISGIQLVKPDGSAYDVDGAALLKTLDSEVYYVANVPVGTYKSVKFKVGVPAATNASFNNNATGIFNRPEMWFTNTLTPGSLVFVNCQGMIDTSAAGNGNAAQMQPFMYMIGTDAHYAQVSMPDHTPAYTVQTGTATYVHMTIDYSKLLTGINLANPANLMVHTAADNNTTVGNTVANNIPSMFSYEE